MFLYSIYHVLNLTTVLQNIGLVYIDRILLLSMLVSCSVTRTNLIVEACKWVATLLENCYIVRRLLPCKRIACL